MTIERAGSAWPDYDWTHTGWTTSGQTALVQRTIDSGGTTSARTETAVVRVPSSTIATSTSRTFAAEGWGEAIASETFGTSNSVQYTYDYYRSTNDLGSYSFVKSKTVNSGTWDAYEYYDASSATSNRVGKVKYHFEPYLDSPSSVSLTQGSGKITYFEYSEDAFGFLTRPALVEIRVNGTLTGKSTTTYAETTVNGMTVVTATRRDYSDATNYLESLTRYYREDTVNTFYRSQIHSITQPGGVKTSYVYQYGAWNSSTSAFSVASGGGLTPDSTHLDSRICVIHGTTATGTDYASHDGYTVDDVYLVDGKSTMEVTIRDKRALVIRTETYVRASGSWSLIGFANYSHNFIGQPTGRTESNGATYDATFDGHLLTSQTDESGVVVSYTYDVAGRMLTAAKTSGPTTTYDYDAAGRVKTTTVSASGTSETIVTTQAYDDAGRLTSSTPPGLSATTVAYNPSARTRTATAPSGATTVETHYLDGRLKQVDGTAVVPLYYTYTIETDGRLRTQTSSGLSTSSRLQKTWIDWLGRSVKSESPGFSVSSQAAYDEEQFYDTTTGRLNKTTRTGSAPTLYVYDDFGGLILTGLDVNNDGLSLSSNDRITGGDTVIESTSDGWWLKSTSTIYPTAGASTAVTASVSRTRLTGHPSNRLSESQSTDAEGNIVTSVADVSRSTKTVTITTTRSGVSTSATQTIVNGLATGATGFDGLSSSAQYDALMRPWKSTDSRSNTTTASYYTGTALTQSVTDAASNVVSTVSYDSTGRTSWTRDAHNQYTYFDYNLRNQLTRQWGAATYPVEYGYDSTYGDRTTMSTFRGGSGWENSTWPTSPGTADTTTWTYDTASALLWEKTDASAKVVALDYNSRGQTTTRTLARGTVTTYGYDTATAELTGLTYSDSTPAVSYTYTRLGQTDTVTDFTGTRDFVYDSSKPWRLSAEAHSSFYGSRYQTSLYESSGVVGRYRGFQVGASAGGTDDLEQAYTYNSSNGRFDTLATKRASNAVTQTFQYGYLSNAPFVSSLSITGGNAFSVAYAYDAQRNLLTSVDSKWSTTSRTKFDYTYDELSLRRSERISGTAFGDYVSGQSYSAVTRYYDYNARGELQTASLYRGEPTTTPSAGDELPGRRFEYRYDNAGNRKNSGPTGNPASGDDEYTTNALNQYTAKENNTVRVTGTAASASSVAVAGATTGKRDRAWAADFAPANSTTAATGTAAIYAATPGGGTGGSDLIKIENRVYFVPKGLQTLTYDDDGNLTSDGVWDYQYDAENRLISMQTTSTIITIVGSTSARHLDFRYDYLGRRVQKIVRNGWNGTTSTYDTVLSETRFLYDGWNLVLELSLAPGTSSLTPLRSYTWGLDLTGSLTAAGGVGALIQIYDVSTGKTLLPTYDGNGNVASLVNASSGDLEAIYEYSPFGEPIRCEGAMAQTNPFRFSSKFTDQETGLVYYGHRYFSPTLGRFINRDPSEESGGLNLYGFCGNNGINRWDRLGLDPWDAEEQLYAALHANDPIAIIDTGTSDLTPEQLASIAYQAQLSETNYAAMAYANSPDGSGVVDPVQLNLTMLDTMNMGAEIFGTPTCTTTVEINGETHGVSDEGAVPTTPGNEANPSTLTNSSTGVSGGDTTQPGTNSEATTTSTTGTTSTIAPDSGGSALGNALRNIPLVGGVLGGVGDIVSGVGNVALGAVTGSGSTISAGLGQIGSGVGGVAMGTLDLAGKAWNAPNTAIGLAYGLVGAGVGLVMGTHPGISIGNNAIQFTNNPLQPTAMTLGNVIVYGTGKEFQPGAVWPGNPNTIGSQEQQHTYQGQVLGPLYFPAHLVGGTIAYINNPADGFINGWHGPQNPLERGPHDPANPRPWP